MLMPVYFAAALVLFRETEILMNCDCDMASIHSLLSRIPVNLPFEKLIQDSLYLYAEYPPLQIENDVKLRVKKLNEEIKRNQREIQTLKNKARKNNNSSFFNSFYDVTKVIFVTAVPVVVGVFIFKFYSNNY